MRREGLLSDHAAEYDAGLHARTQNVVDNLTSRLEAVSAHLRQPDGESVEASRSLFMLLSKVCKDLTSKYPANFAEAG